MRGMMGEKDCLALRTMQTDHKRSNVSSASHDLDSNRKAKTSGQDGIIEKKEKKSLKMR
jgi:hypothetical protein